MLNCAASSADSSKEKCRLAMFSALNPHKVDPSDPSLHTVLAHSPSHPATRPPSHRFFGRILGSAVDTIGRAYEERKGGKRERVNGPTLNETHTSLFLYGLAHFRMLFACAVTRCARNVITKSPARGHPHWAFRHAIDAMSLSSFVC